MKISTKGRYGLRLLLDVALHQSQGPVVLRDIARRQNISPKYLWQMIPPLKTAGLLHATRGPRGGYMLARKPGQITIRDIVSSLEGPISLVDCVATPTTCVRSVSCTAREAWAEIDRKLNAAMAGITLGTLVQRHRKHAK